jgi:hypothetical protein
MLRDWPSWSQDAEFVSLRVREHNPRLLALTNVDLAGAESQHALELGILVVGAEVQVQAILAGFRFRRRHEEYPRHPIGGGSNLILVVGFEYHYPAQGVGPPPTEFGRSRRVDNHLLPLKAHSPTIRSGVPLTPKIPPPDGPDLT